jgi:hypothetical protein
MRQIKCACISKRLTRSPSLELGCARLQGTWAQVLQRILVQRQAWGRSARFEPVIERDVQVSLVKRSFMGVVANQIHQQMDVLDPSHKSRESQVRVCSAHFASRHSMQASFT